MSYPATDCLDSLFQMAPHIMVLEPVEPHPHRNLYHDMVVNEREFLNSRRKRCCRFTRMFAKRAAHRLQAHLTRQHDAEHKEALKLVKRAKSHKLAENYKANASTTNLLEKRMKAGSDASALIVDDEPESCEIINIRASVSNYSPRKTSYDVDNKNGITITVSARLAPHPSSDELTKTPITDHSAPLSHRIHHLLLVISTQLPHTIIQIIRGFH
ncbi:MAG: hypothetical protein Q9209_006102 [Squamulea sp. 1 TL-2023]